jgi:hypothetical protein
MMIKAVISNQNISHIFESAKASCRKACTHNLAGELDARRLGARLGDQAARLVSLVVDVGLALVRIWRALGGQRNALAALAAAGAVVAGGAVGLGAGLAALAGLGVALVLQGRNSSGGSSNSSSSSSSSSRKLDWGFDRLELWPGPGLATLHLYCKDKTAAAAAAAATAAGWTLVSTIKAMTGGRS